MSAEIFEQSPEEIDLPESDHPLTRRLEAAKRAVLVLDEGIKVREAQIEKYKRKLSNHPEIADEESNYTALSNEQKLEYLKLIGEQADVIEEYRNAQVRFVEAIDHMQSAVGGPNVIDNLQELDQNSNQEKE